jgi:hypothetical protein
MFSHICLKSGFGAMHIVLKAFKKASQLISLHFSKNERRTAQAGRVISRERLFSFRACAWLTQRAWMAVQMVGIQGQRGSIVRAVL